MTDQDIKAADRVFGLLEEAAASSARCPTNAAIALSLQTMGMKISPGTVTGLISQLAKDARIEVRVYARLWREVVIRSGRRAGRSTQAPPGGGKPWRVIGG